MLRISIFLCFIFISIIAEGQETFPVQILNAELAIMEPRGNETVKILTKKVKLKQRTTIIDCDSATIFQNNNIEAIGHVIITRPNGTKVQGDFLNYYSELKLAVIKQNVLLTDKKSKLYTTDITYDMNHDIGYYLNGGRLVNDQTTITSLHGTYFSNSSTVLFKQNVIVSHPKYTLKSDSLIYDTKMKRTIFKTATKIDNDSGYIWCNSGWYDEEKNQYSFGRGTIIYNGSQMILTDSILIDKKNGKNRIYKTFEFHDTVAKIHLYGDTAEMWDNNSQMRVFKRPIMIYESSENKPLFIRANTIESIEDKNKNKIIFGFNHVRMYSQEFQSIGDTFIYYSKDSLIQLKGSPYGWKDKSQFNGQQIFINMKNKKPSKISLFNNALIANEEVADNYNQIAGDTIYIDMYMDSLRKITAFKQAKSIYYAEEKNKGYLGLNASESEKLIANFKNGKIDKIIFYIKPKSIFYPIKDITNATKFLPNFVWKNLVRPKSKDDL